MTIPSGQRCIFCQSPYHSYRNCPQIYQLRAHKTASIQAKQDYFGQAPNLFVGHYGYPNVNVGILNVEHDDHHDDPLTWSREGYAIPRIIDLRSSLINARFGANIKDLGRAGSGPMGTGQAGNGQDSFSSRLLDLVREVSIAKRPAEVEINLLKKPSFRLSFDQMAAPHGANAPLRRAALTSNPSVDHHLEKAASDTDLKAGEAVTSLFRKGIDEHRLTRAFSVGNFGIGRNRTLVPTRWSITAVDDTIGKSLIAEVKHHPEGDCRAYLGGYLGNNYLILFFDDVWQYELFEQFVPQQRRKPTETIVAEHDYEPYTGRTDYVHETAGGYYAARLPVLEKLRDLKRQASVLVIRIITEEYSAPLGVWVVREAVRKTLATPPLEFGDRDLMVQYVRAYCTQRFGYDISGILRRSQVLDTLSRQTKLQKWL